MQVSVHFESCCFELQQWMCCYIAIEFQSAQTRLRVATHHAPFDWPVSGDVDRISDNSTLEEQPLHEPESEGLRVRTGLAEGSTTSVSFSIATITC